MNARITFQRALARRSLLQTPSRLRNSSTEATPKPVSPHIGFYKTFTRPIVKVLLMSVLTYQIAYWAWVKLEKDEIKRERSELKHWEGKLEEVTKKDGKD